MKVEFICISCKALVSGQAFRSNSFSGWYVECPLCEADQPVEINRKEAEMDTFPDQEGWEDDFEV